MTRFTLQLSDYSVITIDCYSFAVACATVSEQSDGEIYVIGIIKEVSL